MEILDKFGDLNLILSFSTGSQSFKKICAWEVLGANVLKMQLLGLHTTYGIELM